MTSTRCPVREKQSLTGVSAPCLRASGRADDAPNRGLIAVARAAMIGAAASDLKRLFGVPRVGPCDDRDAQRMPRPAAKAFFAKPMEGRPPAPPAFAGTESVQGLGHPGITGLTGGRLVPVRSHSHAGVLPWKRIVPRGPWALASEIASLMRSA